MPGPDVAILGGGIVGVAAAAALADAGARVTIVERSAIGSGASGRNSGSVQHPFDPLLADLHRATLEAYLELAADPANRFRFPARPAGLLLLSADEGSMAERARRLAATIPELDARAMHGAELAELEPALAPGLAACRLETGHPIPPAAATSAFARAAERSGATFEVGQAGRPLIADGRVAGVELADGRRIASEVVLVATGPSAPAVLDPVGHWRPIVATWGVTASVAFDGSIPRAVLEEDAVEAFNAAPETEGPVAPESIFSLVSAGGASIVGSTALLKEPRAAPLAAELVRRGAMFVPSLAGARILESRVCARPQSIDGRPLLGPVPSVVGLYLAAGHGPWGISTGPASARSVADAILGVDVDIPAGLRPERFGEIPVG